MQSSLVAVALKKKKCIPDINGGMDTYNTSAMIQEALDCLVQYYGFTFNQLPVDVGQALATTRHEDALLQEAYAKLTPGSNNADLVMTALRLLCYSVKYQPGGELTYTADGLKAQLRRRDLLRLLILCKTTKTGDALIIKNKTRSFDLHNDSGWFVCEMIEPFLVQELGKDFTAEMAAQELEQASTRHRGRQPKDPQMLHLIFGTYRLLSAHHHFRTPMPNALCSFIIRLLQIMDILPEHTEIDTFWIRAQLRYMRSQRKDER